MAATQYLSVVDLLADRLAEHEHAEADVLKSYQEAARGSSDPAVSFLMGLIFEDEKRHHAWMRAAALSLQELSHRMEASSLPPFGHDAPDDHLLNQTEVFLDAEKQALDDLKGLEDIVRLAQTEDRAIHHGMEISRSPKTSAWIQDSPLELLVDLMREDTKRHIRILETIKKRLS